MGAESSVVLGAEATKQIQTRRLIGGRRGFMMYAVEMGSGAMIIRVLTKICI
jgi:hypothetical protein